MDSELTEETEMLTDQIPPYVSYKTLINFLTTLQREMPTRIDRSTMRSLSGSAQGRLLATLRFFDLIDAEGRPEKSLVKLVNGEGAERQKNFRDLVCNSYRFIFAESFDLSRASKQELQEAFARQGISGDNLRKAISLFLALCRISRLHVSLQICSRRRSRSNHSRLGLRISHAGENSSASDRLNKSSQGLISKLPAFDPVWSDSMKISWFECFHELIRNGREAQLPKSN
jgi:hypothetical protein